MHVNQTSFSTGLISRKLGRFSYLCFRLTFIQCLTSFSSVDHLLPLYVWFLILFHLSQIKFSQSIHLLICLSLETLMSIIRTGLPVPVELIDLVNSVISNTLLRWLTFLLGSQTVILTVLFFWVYLFLLTLVFVLQLLSVHFEILIILLSQFPLALHQIRNGMPRFIA